MVGYQRKIVLDIISSEIRVHGFLRLNQLTLVLEKHGKQNGISRDIYSNQGPKHWIESNFPEFRIDGNNGKEIIVFSDYNYSTSKNLSEQEITIEEEIISLDALYDSADKISAESSYRIGVVNFCNYKSAFINRQYEKNRLNSDELSVIFNPAIVKTFPEKMAFDTKNFVYLVCYATSGTVLNTKTGIEHPAFDYSVPMKIISELPKNQCSYIKITSEKVIIGHIVASKQCELDINNAVYAINEFLQNELSKNTYILSSRFPNIAKECGLSNFRDYSDSVELFLEKYLPRYELKKNVIIEGKRYPGIIVLKGNISSEIETTDDYVISSEQVVSNNLSFTILDELFENGRYVDYLSSDILKNTQPQNLPLKYLEKALTCAHRLLYPDSLDSINLNNFQKELVNNPTSAIFIKKWKIKGVFSIDMITQCGDTAIAHFDYPEHNALIVKLLDAIGSKKTLNNNYAGITDRFVACENVLIPHFYIIRAFVQNTKASIQKIVSEYCQMVKDIRHSTSGPRMSDDLRMCAFADVLRIIHANIFDCSQLDINIRTNIVSVFFEYDKMLALKGIISLWDTCHTSTEWRLIDLYFNLDEWNEQDFVQLIDDGVNRQLLQRCIALLWRESCHANILTEKFLNLLSWVILHDDYTSIDEIIRYPSGKSLNRIDKQNILINMFETMCDCAMGNDKMYVLASYVIYIIQENLNFENTSTDVTAILDKWNKFSSDFFTRKTQDFDCITLETELSFVNLFVIFQLDLPNYLKLQEHYAEWLINKYPPKEISADNMETILEKTYKNGSFSAFVEYFSFDLRPELQIVREKHAKQYIESLIRLRRYTDAISFLRNSQNSEEFNKNALLISAIGENFRVNGISTKAFSCVEDSLMCDETINFLLSEFNSTKPKPLIINSLIALYIYTKKYMNAAYLATVFGSKADKGFARFYSQVRSKLRNYVDLNKLKSNYHVVATAFQTLYADDLVDFLNWTNGITVPNYKEHTERHAFSFYYDDIMANVTSKDVWVSLLNHLVKNGLEKNAWDICVCETVLHKVLNYQGNHDSQNALDYILNSTDLALYPKNFLAYAFEIIKDDQSSLLCQKLVEVLKNKILYSHIITDNVWMSTFENNITSFKQYCQNAFRISGNPAFHEILSLLGTELSITELKEVTQSVTSKQPLFAKICYNYLNDYNMQETMEVLFSEDWSGMTDSEYAVLNILRLVCSDDDELLLDAEGLFDDEYSVWRFKRDCVEIISTYPEKTGLFAFDKACDNESYKMLVYSYIFEVLYDQDIYESLDKRFSDFKDFQSYKVYLRLLECSYKAQSIQNSTFPFFYKKWRYLKLYLARLLRTPLNIDDADILTLMEKNGLYNDVYVDSYVPFVETVKQFMRLDDISQEFKTHFLFAVMVSHSEDLYDKYAQLLSTLPTQQKLICRKLIAFLDYRYFNFSLFDYLWKNIKEGDFSIALPLAESISDYAFDTLVALKDNYNYSTAAIFEKLAFMDKGSQILNSIITMDISVISEQHHWIIPLLCSRQFDFWISNRFRSMVITQRDNMVCKKYKYISDYLVKKGKSLGIYIHLCSLLACLKNNQELAKRIIGDGDFCSLVPNEWSDEAERIVDYANGVIHNFKPNKTYLDGSRENNDENANFSFPKIILESVFDEVNIPTSDQAATESYKSYCESNDPWMRSKLGLELIRYITESPSSDIAPKLPPLKDLVLDVGLGLLHPEMGLTLENRFAVVKELYESRSIYYGKKYSNQMDNLKSKFASMINTCLSLEQWIKYSSIIKEFLSETNALIDFVELKKRILDECEKLASSDIGNENKIKQYTDIKNKFFGLTSPYSTSVKRAIDGEIERLANGIMLSIEIENSETTDGCVYFQIKNTGKRTVSFASEALAIILKQKNQPDETVKLQHIVELRSESMTGGVAQLAVSSDKIIKVKLSIIHNLSDGSKEIICSASKELLISPPCSPIVPTEALIAARQSVSSAVTDDRLLFGREDKKKLLAMCIPSGVTLIYGPSRIGKTSLMNWIRNKHAVDQGNVMTILIGGEAFGRDGNYDRNFFDQTKNVPYNDPYKMSQYLLVDTIIYGLTKRSIFGRPKNVEVPDDFIKDMLLILKDESTDIVTKYYEINERLKKSDLELWLLLDEFQRVVERWEEAPAWCEFFEICNLLSSSGENDKPDRIKIIFCGSDDLLTHMTLKRDSVWKNAFRSTISVNSLEEEPYKEMFKKDKAISMTNLRFSPLAISALFNYTGGIALYGKEIGRAIFEEISENAQKWASRSTIFTSDIAETTQRLLDRQNHDLSIRAKEGISTIYSAVTKKLDECTVMPLLWEMADYISQNPQQDGFPENYFSKVNLNRNFEEKLDDSFSIAVAREIIKKSKKSKSHYTFTTLFYYFAFCGSAPKDKSSYKNLIYANDNIEDVSAVSHPFDDLHKAFEQVPTDNKAEALHMLLGALSKYEDEEQKFRKSYGDYYEVHIGTQNNVQVNIQSMTNAFATLLSGDVSSDKYLAAFRELPSVQMFIPPESKKLLGERIAAYHEADDEKTLREAEYKVEELTIPAERAMTSTYIAAAVNSTDFFKVTEDRWESLIHITKKELELYLPSEFITSLGFAVMLHNVFEAIRTKASKDDIARAKADDELDYCPVAIMYCKVVEALLKELHTPIYARRLKDGTLSSSSNVVFGDLLNADGTVDTNSKDLTIGSFSYHIVKPSNFDEDNNIDHPEKFKYEPKPLMIQKITNVSSYTQAINLEWFQHAVDLSVIQGVRNKSAHEARPITRANFDWLIKTLFDEGELLRIARLAKSQYPSNL